MGIFVYPKNGVILQSMIVKIESAKYHCAGIVFLGIGKSSLTFFI